MTSLRSARTASTTVTCSLRGLLCHSSAVTSRSSCTSTTAARTRLAVTDPTFQRGHHHHRHRRPHFRLFSSTTDKDAAPTLVRFSKTQLAYPSSSIDKEDLASSAFMTQPFDFSILAPPEIGGSRQRRQQQRQRRSGLDDGSNSAAATAAAATPSHPNRRRGYLLLGRNGSGKSLLGHALMDTNLYASRRNDVDADNCNVDSDNHNAYVRSGTLTVDSKWHSRAVAHVSFDSHQELLRQKDTKVIGVTTAGEGKDNNTEKDRSISAFRAIAGDGVSKLNKAAQFLVVRFGLYALLHRPVSTLSTGEIRKVLLIRALAQRPKLLVLDNAFDGLDVSSREILKDIVRRTLRGFTQDILVHDVAAKDTARTQVVLMTHRIEEMMIPDMETVAFWRQPEDDKNSDQGHYLDDPQLGSTATLHLLEDYGHRMALNTEGEMPKNGRGEATDDWEESKTNETTNQLDLAEIIMDKAIGIKDAGTDHSFFDWEDPSLPSIEEVEAWWQSGPKCNTGNIQHHSEPSILVEARDLSIRRGDVTLLNSLNWTIRKGERWVVGGGNGAGKSTFSRFLARPDEELHADNMGVLKVFAPAKTAWVSTESHLQQVEALKADVANKHTTTTARSFMEGKALDTVSWERAILPVLSWLGTDSHTMLSKPFLHLSQGHQKMFLVARALASQPSLLVLDEPCQGLDISNRRRMLTLVERVCRATDMSLVYITHHYEELLPSIGHALHLKDRYAVFNGLMDSYNPAHYEGHD